MFIYTYINVYKFSKIESKGFAIPNNLNQTSAKLTVIINFQFLAIYMKIKIKATIYDYISHR